MNDFYQCSYCKYIKKLRAWEMKKVKVFWKVLKKSCHQQKLMWIRSSFKTWILLRSFVFLPKKILVHGHVYFILKGAFFLWVAVARAHGQGKTTNKMVRRRCRRRVLFCKIQVRLWSCRSYPLRRRWVDSGSSVNVWCASLVEWLLWLVNSRPLDMSMSLDQATTPGLGSKSQRPGGLWNVSSGF